MSWSLPHSVTRVLVGAWLANSPNSWRRRMMADDAPFVHAAGTNPDRIFMTGDGVASGRGVITHELGLPGYLARNLTAITQHATDVDLVVHQDMTVESCFREIVDVDLFRFDAIVLSVGHNEVLSLMTVERWTAGMRALLDQLTRSAPASTPIFVLSIPYFEARTMLPGVLARVVDAHARVLNAATLRLLPGLNAIMLPVSPDNEFEEETRPAYQRWSERIAFEINKRLDPDRITAAESARVDEGSRLAAVERIRADGHQPDAVLDGITDAARRAFGTSIAAISFIDDRFQTLRAVSGIDPYEARSEDTFCDTTIRRASHHIVEDASTDPRFAHFPMVTGGARVRFYAGYPIESPDGYRVGALCVMDPEPRRFSQDDVALLRSLTQLAERHLWH